MSVTIDIIHRTYSSVYYIYAVTLQDPNWYKAKRADGLEGMIPANFVRDNSDGPAEVVVGGGSKQAVKLQEMPSVLLL